MKKAFILFTLVALYGTVFMGCSSSTGGSPEEGKKNDTSAEQSNKPVVKISCNDDSAFSRKDLVLDLTFEKYDSNPTSVDVFIENNSNVYAANCSVTSNKVTVTVPASFTENTIKFYVKAGEVESNHISLKYGYSVTVNELEDFINSLTTTDAVLLRVTGEYNDFATKLDLLKNENLKINLDLRKMEINIADLSDCISLESVLFPEQIQSFKLKGCKNLIEINMPDSITNFGTSTFQSCRKLTTKIVIPENQTVIQGHTFSFCKSIKEFVIHDNVTEICISAFQECDSLEFIHLPNKLQTIGEMAFQSCDKLQEIIMPHGVQIINRAAFANCSSLKKVSFPDTLVSIGKRAFYGSFGEINNNIDTLVIPASVNTIGEEAFGRCEKLTNIVFKNKTGWKAGETVISESELGNSANAARLLTETYKDVIWTRVTE